MLRAGCRSLLGVPSFSGLYDPERNHGQPVTLWAHKNVSNLLYPNPCYLETSLCSVHCSSCFSNRLPTHLAWPPDFPSAPLPLAPLQPSARPSVLSCVHLWFWPNAAPILCYVAWKAAEVVCLSVSLPVCLIVSCRISSNPSVPRCSCLPSSWDPSLLLASGPSEVPCSPKRSLMSWSGPPCAPPSSMIPDLSPPQSWPPPSLRH